MWTEIANTVYASSKNNLSDIKKVASKVIFDQEMPEIDEKKFLEAQTMSFEDDNTENHYRRCLMVVGNYLRGSVAPFKERKRKTW